MMNESEKNKIKVEFPIGKIMEGEVFKHMHFGIFINLNDSLMTGIIEIVQMGYIVPISQKDFPVIGSIVQGEVLGYDFSNAQIYLRLICIVSD